MVIQYVFLIIRKYYTYFQRTGVQCETHLFPQVTLLYGSTQNIKNIFNNYNQVITMKSGELMLFKIPQVTSTTKLIQIFFQSLNDTVFFAYIFDKYPKSFFDCVNIKASLNSSKSILITERS